MEAALITALASIVLFLVTAAINENFKRNQKAWERDLARCDDQIGKLYAPLENLVEQLDAIDDIKKQMIEQDPGHASEISKFCYDNYFGPLHEKIAKLIESNLYLLEDKSIPSSFIEYYKHVASERVYFSLSQNMEDAKNKNLLPYEAKELVFVPHPYPENQDDLKPNLKRTIKFGSNKVQDRQERILKRLRKTRRVWPIRVSR